MKFIKRLFTINNSTKSSQKSKIETLSNQFLELMVGRRRKIDLYTIDFERWFDGAWGTINESLRNKGGYGYLKDKKELIRNSIEIHLQNFPSKEDEVEKWYVNSILEIQDGDLLTVGRTQKLVNMLIKYHVTHHYSQNQSNELIEKLISNLASVHVPIDRIILSELRRKYPEFRKIIDINIRLKNDQGKYAWSNLTDVDLYIAFQNKLKEKSIELGYSSPLEFEMNELWITR